MTEIADALELGQPSVSKHLQVLRDVGLVHVRREAGGPCTEPTPRRFARFTTGAACSRGYWRGQLRRIKAHAEEER